MSRQNPFPEGFLWGASTAAYQVEGGIDDVDWAQAAREGKVPPAGAACEFYTRYASDYDLAQSLGMNAQRLSIEWARIEPQEGRFDINAIAHYRDMIGALRERGMEPFINLWHFTLPTWFSDRGGFFDGRASETFARYCAHVVEKLGGDARMWLTINEPMVYSGVGFLRGEWPPFHKKDFVGFLRMIDALAHAHNLAYTEMKKVMPDVKIGIAKNNIYYEADHNPFNIVAAMGMNWFWNERFLNKIARHQDFIGLNHYRWRKFGLTAEEQKGVVYSDFGWEVHSESLYHCLHGLKKYHLPVYVTEHGVADEKDVLRPLVLRNAVRSMRRAREEGVEVKGYFHWSLLDNYEWAQGYTKKFGLIAVDFETQVRTMRPSADVYKEIITRNGLLE